MAEVQRFRSAFNGFNREDVVHYIEYLNSNHNNQINQLKADLAAMRQEKAAGWSDGQNAEELLNLKERCAQLEEQLAAVTSERDEALEAAEAARQEVPSPAVPVIQHTPRLSGYVEDELAAYRRAERMERESRDRAESLEREARDKARQLENEAKARVDAIYAQIQSVLSNAITKADDAATQLNGISDNLYTQIQAIQKAVNSSSQVLHEVADSLGTGK